MNRLQILRKRAAAKGVYVYRAEIAKCWDIIVDAEWLLGPRGLLLSYREAVHLAYAICKAKHNKIVVTNV